MTTTAAISIFIGLVVWPRVYSGPFWPGVIPMILFIGGGTAYFLARRYYRYPNGKPPKIPKFIP
jgi:hypothetical protein